MNIFVLDLNPRLAAQYHCDKHVRKMVIETAQILSTAHKHWDSYPENAYKPTHENHPCNIWARQCKENYDWLWDLFYSLNVEYHHRYGKVHLTGRKLLNSLRSAPSDMPRCSRRTPFALAMPDEYKCKDPVEAYRAYYLNDKRDIAKWAHSEVPPWWQ